MCKEKINGAHILVKTHKIKTTIGKGEDNE